MTGIPEEVVRLAEERSAARRAKDFAEADSLRERIRASGFDVTDTPDGFELEPLVAKVRRIHPEHVESVLDEHPVATFSVQWVVQGWPEDTLRGLESFRRFQGGRDIQYVVVDASGTHPSFFPSSVDEAPLEDDFGWAVDRNAGLQRTAGRIVVVVDGSIEVTGDVFAPLERAMADDSVGVAGPFGVVTDDLREFEASDGIGEDRQVDAVEGYLMAFRRDILPEVGFFDEKFRFYRSADIEYSFRIRDRGYKAVVVPLPVIKHEHRMWASTSEQERDRLSKRNFYRFLERWRDRSDLIVRGKP